MLVILLFAAMLGLGGCWGSQAPGNGQTRIPKAQQPSGEQQQQNDMGDYENATLTASDIQSLMDAMGEQDGRYWVQIPAMNRLVEHGDEPAVVQALRAEFQGDNDQARLLAAHALFLLDDAAEERLEYLLKTVESANEAEKGLFRWTFGVILLDNPEEEHIVRITQSLDSESAYARRMALRALTYSAEHPYVLQAMLDAAQDDEPCVRGTAAAVLGAQWREESLVQDPRIMHALVGLLADEDAVVRSCAAAALQWHGPTLESLHALLQATRDEDAEVRAQAVDSLGYMAVQREDVLEALMRALDDSDEHVKWRAVQALGTLGPFAAEALPTIHGFLDSEIGCLRSAAKEAIAAIEGN
jgi:HEAT repeat protein